MKVIKNAQKVWLKFDSAETRFMLKEVIEALVDCKLSFVKEILSK